MTPLPHHPSVAPDGLHWLLERLRRDARPCAPDEEMSDAEQAEQAYASMLLAGLDKRGSVLLAEIAAANAVVDAAVAETVAEQNAVRHTTTALDAPNRSAALTTAGDAARAVHAARAARRDAVQRLLQHRQDHE